MLTISISYTYLWLGGLLLAFLAGRITKKTPVKIKKNPIGFTGGKNE